MPWSPPPELATLEMQEIAQLLQQRKLPPVEQWKPQRDADSHIRIAADGRWYHMGSEIKRPGLVALFSTILRREADGRHALVTPFERQFVEVEDTAFAALQMKSEGQGKLRNLAFRLSSDALIIAGTQYPLFFGGTVDNPRPLIAAGRGLLARIKRSLYYEIVELALEEQGSQDDAATHPGIWSGSRFFALDDPDKANAAIAIYEQAGR